MEAIHHTHTDTHTHTHTQGNRNCPGQLASPELYMLPSLSLSLSLLLLLLLLLLLPSPFSKVSLIPSGWMMWAGEGGGDERAHLEYRIVCCCCGCCPDQGAVLNSLLTIWHTMPVVKSRPAEHSFCLSPLLNFECYFQTGPLTKMRANFSKIFRLVHSFDLFF